MQFGRFVDKVLVLWNTSLQKKRMKEIIRTLFPRKKILYNQDFSQDWYVLYFFNETNDWSIVNWFNLLILFEMLQQNDYSKASSCEVFGSMKKMCISKAVHHEVGKNLKNPWKIQVNSSKYVYLKCFGNQFKTEQDTCT